MIIPARNIPKYFHTLTFPVDILEERSDRIVATVSRPELLGMIHEQCVIAVGSYCHIKRLRYLYRKPTDRPAQRHKIQFYPKAEDCKTVFLAHLTWSHHPSHCAAFSRGRGALAADCL